jgi:hypothetical protein
VQDAKVEYNNLNVAGRLQIRAADKLDPESCKRQRPDGPRRNRIVLLGGPGQGKSTIGQFMCQVARVRLLLATSSLSPESEELLQPILGRAKTEGVPITGPCRFPIRIDLPTFADALERSKTAEKSLTLLSHVANRLSRELDCSVDVDDLRAWLRACPWLLVLDGLDEVPASGNRDVVVKSIDTFWDEVHLASADVLVIVTSRPQGYKQALSRRHWEHWELAPLSVMQAKKVAARLGEVRLSDVERRAIVLAELHRSFSDPSTRLLSSTPLQVTILFGIALLKGTIPHAKWDLFERYYTLLRDRESQKAGSDAALFRDFKHQIDALHYEAGFILQVAAESAGAATSFLTTDQLTELIKKILKADEFDDATISKVVAELRRIATERLVLLTPRIEGRISFEVRSLQEFMAAGQITSASPVAITERLRAIASSAHWRHVYRIAASKIFSVTELAFLRADVIGICHLLDNGDLGEASRCVCAGARLAVDLLTDGVADSAPRFKKGLLRRAFSILDNGSYNVDPRLASFLTSDTLTIFDEEIRDRLKTRFTNDAWPVYSLLGQLLQSHPEWASARLLDYWPQEPNDAVRLVERFLPPQLTASLVEQVMSTQEKVSPQRIVKLHRFLRHKKRHVPSGDEGIKKAAEWILIPPGFSMPELTRVSCFNVQTNCAGQFVSVKTSDERYALQYICYRNGWAVIESISQFIKEPSKETLANVAGSLVHWKNQGELAELVCPWPVQSIIADFEEGCPISTLVAESRDGRFGDLSDWKKAEERWSTSGLLSQDFIKWNDGRYLNREIAEIGAPAIITMRRSRRAEFPDFDLALETTRRISSVKKRHRVMGVVLDGIRKVSDENLRRQAIDYLVSQIPNYQSPTYYSRLAENSDVWSDAGFLQALESNIDDIKIGYYWIPDSATKIDLNGRWRKLIPIFVERVLERAANTVSASSQMTKEVHVISNDEDAKNVHDAITVINFAQGKVHISKCPWLANSIWRSDVEPGLIHSVLKKWLTREECVTILTQLAKMERLGSGMARRGYNEVLGNELEAKPSPLTHAPELTRLGLPIFETAAKANEAGN